MNARSWQIVFLSLITGILVYLGYILRPILMPVLIALLLAYVLSPALTWLKARRISSGASVAIIFGSFLLFFGLALLIVVPRALREGAGIAHDVFVGDANQESMVATAVHWVRSSLPQSTIDQLKDYASRFRSEEHGSSYKDLARTAGASALTVGAWLAGGLGALFAAISFFVLVPVYLFFFLCGIHAGWERFKRSLPERYQERILGTIARIHRANAAFFRGQLSICALDGMIIFVALLILGVPFSFFLGIFYALTALIPFLGPIISFCVVLLVAAIGSCSITTLFVIAGLYALIQILDSLLFQPWLLGKGTGLHPLVIMLSLLCFGQLLGIFGMLLAVPLCSTCIILFQDYVLPVYRDVTRPAS